MYTLLFVMKELGVFWYKVNYADRSLSNRLSVIERIRHRLANAAKQMPVIISSSCEDYQLKLDDAASFLFNRILWEQIIRFRRSQVMCSQYLQNR